MKTFEQISTKLPLTGSGQPINVVLMIDILRGVDYYKYPYEFIEFVQRHINEISVLSDTLSTTLYSLHSATENMNDDVDDYVQSLLKMFKDKFSSSVGWASMSSILTVMRIKIERNTVITDDVNMILAKVHTRNEITKDERVAISNNNDVLKIIIELFSNDLDIVKRIRTIELM